MEDFEIDYSNAFDWYESSKRLKISSALIEKELVKPINDNNQFEMISYINSYMMLLGFSMENYLKGASIEIYKLENGEKEITKFDDLKSIWKSKDGHDLLSIYTGIGISPTSQEKEFLETLTTHIKYAGRYQFPVKAKDFKPKRYYRTKYTSIEDQIKKKIESKIKSVC